MDNWLDFAPCACGGGFGVVFLGVLAVFAFVIAKGIGQWAYNNRQPLASTNARIITKRSEAGSYSSGGTVWTWYYATFELDSGERLEFEIKGKEYGLLAEGDRGTLRYQGTRYLGFQRQQS